MDNLSALFTEIGKFLGSLPWVAPLMSMIWFLLVAIAAGGVVCATCGKKSAINRGISTMFLISMLYMAAFFICTYFPSSREVLSKLPFLSVGDEGVQLLDPLKMSVSDLFPALLKFLIMAFLFNCTETFLPTGLTLLSWSIWRTGSTFLAVGLYSLLCFVINYFFARILGDLAIFFVLLFAFVTLLVLLLRFIFKQVLNTDNAAFNNVYKFFAINIFGNQFARMVETGLLSIAAMTWFSHKGYGTVAYADFDPLVFWPTALLFGGTLYVFTMVYNEKRS